MNLEISEDSTYIFTASRTDKNALKSLTSATITINAPSGAEMVAATAMMVAGDVATKSINFAVDVSAGSWSKARNYIAVFKFTYADTTTETWAQMFDIVRYAFVNHVTDQNLIDENRMLADGIQEDSGKASSGTINTLVDLARTEGDDYWNGGKLLIEPLTDTGKVTEHKITDFVSSTGTFTFAPAATAVTVESYTVRRSYQSQITAAGDIVREDLLSQKKRAYLCVDTTQLSRLILYKFFERYFQQARGAEGDNADLQYKYYSAKYSELFGNIALQYDEDEDGAISEDEQDSTMSVLELSR